MTTKKNSVSELFDLKTTRQGCRGFTVIGKAVLFKHEDTTMLKTPLRLCLIAK